jgi:hypothetical protein
VTVVVRVSVPAVPEIESVYVPVFVVVVVRTLRVEVVDVGFGEKDGVAPTGRPLTLSVTAPVKPPEGAIETAYAAVPPRTIGWLAGAALSEKSGLGGGGGWLTTSVTLAESVVAPAVPVIVRGYVPTGVVELVARVSAEESAGFGANPAVVPAGTPVTESVTGSLKPPVRLTVTE